MRRKVEIKKSLINSKTTLQQLTKSSLTIKIKQENIKILSAIGSKNFPKSETLSFLRASIPSNKSVAAARENSINASKKNSDRIKAHITGDKIMRKNVRELGELNMLKMSQNHLFYCLIFKP